MDKVDKYDWKKLDAFGVQKMICIDDLHIDTMYQRSPCSARVIFEIARNFSWANFGVISVCQREGKNGYWVVDGQQRIIAAKKRGDIVEVPCIIQNVKSIEQEASAFVSINTSRKPVSSIDKFNAAVIANMQPQKDIYNWCLQQQITIGQNADKRNIEFTGILLDLWKSNAECSKAAILAQLAVCDEKPPRNELHRGFFWLLQKDVQLHLYIDKIVALGGKVKCISEIRSFCIETSRNPSNEACGRAILRLINKGLRNKIVIA